MDIIEDNTNEPDTEERLLALIREMPEEEKLKLLEVLIEGNLAAKRQFPRKPCFIVANYSTADTSGADMVQNISVGGVFIESRQDFELGQEIMVSLGGRNNYTSNIKIKGRVTRLTPNGAGIEFQEKIKTKDSETGAIKVPVIDTKTLT